MQKPFSHLRTILTKSVLILGACLLALVVSSPAQAEDDYRLGPDDVLQVIVARHPEFSVDLARVSSAGKIQVPVVESIFVAGMTVAQLDRALTKALSSRLKRPEVTVILKIPRPKPIFLVGAVVKPGTYEIQSGWRVTDALAAGGGPSTRPEMVVATLDRKGQKPVVLDLPKIIKDAADHTNVVVRPGDTLRLDPRTIPITVVGKVTRPGQLDVPRGSTVVTAVAVAGGLATGADKTQITVQRVNGKIVTVNLYKVMEGNQPALDIKLESGDLITVPESNNRVTLTGAGVVRPGTYDMIPGVAMKISQVLAQAGGYLPRAALTQATIRHADGTNTTVNLYNVMKLNNQKENIEILPGDLITVPESNARVTVQGAVLKPGPFDIPDGEKLRVADAVALAGGPAPEAALTKVKVRRAGGKEVPVDLYKVSVLGVPDDNIELAPDDIVTVPQAKGITVLGVVAKPNTYYLEAGKAPRVADALAAAGGLAAAAGESVSPADVRISILRNGPNGTQQTLKIDPVGLLVEGDQAQNAVLQDGDNINISEIPKPLVFISGEVNKPGQYEIKEGEGLPELLARASGTTTFAALKSVSVKHRNQTKVIDVFDAVKKNTPMDFQLYDGDNVVVPKNQAQVLVTPAVKAPDYYPIPEDHPLTVGQALSLAGGPLNDAKTKEIAVLRQTPTGVQRTIIRMDQTQGNKLALNQVLQNGDIVYVPSGVTTPSTWEKISGIVRGLGPLGLLF